MNGTEGKGDEPLLTQAGVKQTTVLVQIVEGEANTLLVRNTGIVTANIVAGGRFKAAGRLGPKEEEAALLAAVVGLVVHVGRASRRCARCESGDRERVCQCRRQSDCGKDELRHQHIDGSR